MKLQMNLAPCHRKARVATVAGVTISLVAIVIGVSLEILAAKMSRDMGRIPAALKTNSPVLSPSFHNAERMVGELRNFDLGKGRGIASMLSELEQCLPQNVHVSRIQYKLADGTLRLELAGDESKVLGDAVTALEKRFGRVRVLERQGRSAMGGKGIWLRLLVEEEGMQ